MTFTDEIFRLQGVARSTPLGHRSPKYQLYELLGECMDLAYRAEGNPTEEAELRQLVRGDNRHNKKGRWVEKDSDTYLLVCRFVFYDPGRATAERGTGWRYATVLREAAKRQVTPSELAQYLRENGGMNALVQTRPVETQEVTTKTLLLDRAITVRKGQPFTLTLKRLPDNRYEVIEA